MLMKKGKRFFVIILGLALVLTLVGFQGGGHLAASPPLDTGASAPLGTGFTYQGALSDASGPVHGTCSFTFKLYDDAGGGTLLGTLSKPGVEVVEGHFAVELDFGAGAFNGEARWLEIDVNCGGGTTTLSPRLKLTLTPYALYSRDSDKVDGQHASGFVSRAGATVDNSLTFSGWSSAYDWQVGWESATVPPDPDSSWFYVKDLDDAAQPLRLLIWEDSGDVIVAKNLGVGTDSPQARLHVQGDSRLIGDQKGVYSEGPAYGVEAASDGVGVLGKHLGSGNYAELGRTGDAIHAVAWSGKGVFVQAPNGDAVYAESGASAKSGVYGVNTHNDGYGVFGMNNQRGNSGYLGGAYGVYGQSASNDGVRGASSASSKSGVYGINGHNDGFGVYGRNSQTGNVGYLGGAYGVYGESASSAAYAAAFKGNVAVLSQSTGILILELGEGLDYAEGFDVSGAQAIRPGTVLVIDPDHPGELTMSGQPYDHKVAGIVAGARGLGSGVRLGADRYDYDVALAGRVYCYVDATEEGVEAGDLLTTSTRPGYAMKVSDHDRAQGAILGKAMEGLEKGQRGLILVLVTLQ